MENQFDKYVNLIRNVSWKISKKYNVEYDEIEAQGYLIYCMILEKFDITKSSFSTYLYIQLSGRLKDYALSLKSKTDDTKVYELNNDKYELDPFLLSCESKDYDLKNEFIEKAFELLDADSFKVMDYLISFEWLKKNKRKPTISDVMRKFNFNRDYANIIWDNCRNFWINNVA